MFNIKLSSGIQELPDGRKFEYDAKRKIFKRKIEIVNTDSQKLPNNIITADKTSEAMANKIWVGTKVNYDKIDKKSETTIYCVKD